MSVERTLITGGTVLTVDPEYGRLDKGDVLVENGKIAAIAPRLDVVEAEVIDATDMIVLPGFVDTHRHTWQAPVRNIGSDWTLGQYLAGIHFGFSKLFRPHDTYVGNLLGVAEALDSGITTLLDWSHNLETPDHADSAVQALLDSGSRAVFAHGGGASMWHVPSAIPHDRDVFRLRDRYFSSDDQLVTMAFAARGPQFTTPEIAIEDWQLARELGVRITVHVGDGEWGKSRPVAWMREHGLLGPEVTYVHCNTIGDDELKMIADTGGSASVSADIETQMGHGWPATGRLLDVGIRPGLSIDVCTSNAGNMFNAMRSTLAVQRALDNAAEERPGQQDRIRLTCRDVLEFATIEGARANGLDRVTGSLTPGKDADIVLLRADALTMTPLNNPAAAVVYNGHPGLVDSVMVRGRFVKRDGKLTELDVNRIRAMAIETRDYLVEQAKTDPYIAECALGGGWIPGSVQPPRAAAIVD
ncbi:cytosine/adenosine deaminase-related metal-dependent hydrolase [Saccharopolyspora phatthalungensis]|uniref:Cytosine/adenosine deaminase-related metal-dependent hydrolase n=2 Tax=Saccharopolyspora phatthalungensis TaxID=664693 RepID=A0A840Q8V0_9PSEU|nr:cytosine/adenosine deaminase-related metal-dependent hydrolase [Saccharopolyspora phatthalungensis]